MTAVGMELESQLQSMLEMRPPGANQQKISSITQFCNANISNESVLVQKIFTHFKKAPANYKLGALYVVDSIARAWLDHAKKAGQELGQNAPAGSYAGGVYHIQELLPSLMNDVATHAPAEHKIKTKKLIDIWRRGATFPTHMIARFEEQLNQDANSTTPTGTPPQSAVALANNAFTAPAGASAAPASQNVSDILKGLASFAPSNTPNQAHAPIPTPAPISMMPQGSYPPNMPVNGTPVQYSQVSGQQQPSMNGQNQAQNNPLAGLLAGVGIPPQQAQQPQFAPQQQAPAMPPMQGVPGGMDPNMMKQLQILAQLKAMNVPQEQWAALLPIMMNQSLPQQGAPTMPAPNAQGSFPGMASFGGVQADQTQSRDYDGLRSPNRGERRRSRSPGYERRRDESPPRRRDSPTYGRYGEDRDSNRRGGRDRGGRGGRNRSPDRFRRSPSPRRQQGSQDGQGTGNDTDWGYVPRNMSVDPSLPKDSIRVYSRTLFVGGVTCSEDELRRIFSAHGRVQTCIVNIDKRHAFVKMLTREEAIRAKEAMEHYRTDSMQLRTRWGVGYGPRDCSDYGTGVSIIPIHRLTDADRKWMLTAPYGGSGGDEIKTGLTVEEPDIEIGAGVSSKAISRRMQTDRSGQHGPRSSRDQRGGRRGGEDDNPNNISVAPQVPGYGFNFGNLNNGNANAVPLGMNQNYGQGS